MTQKKTYFAHALGVIALCNLAIWSGQAAHAQEVFSLANKAVATPSADFKPEYKGGDQRFSYSNTGETRLKKGVRTFKLSLGGIPGEIGDIVSFPVRNPKTAGLFLLGTAALISVDRQTTTFWQDHVEPQFSGLSNGVNVLPSLTFIPRESRLVIATIGMAYLGGLVFNDERAQTAALLAGKASAYSYLTSQLILKPIFGRLRPSPNLSTVTGNTGEYTTNPWDFGHGGGQIPFGSVAYATSLPSFHFTQYFAIARVYSGIYDNAAWPYMAAGLIAVTNIRGHHHWVSDMAAGAVIGLGIGSLILKHYQNRKAAQGHVFVMPMVSRDSVGVSMSVEF